jgi:Ner family transcriptional regulator
MFGMPNACRSKKPALKDWHPADVKAALEKTGWTLRRLSLAHGYAAKSLAAVLYRRWLAAERIVAETIGTAPDAIWPSRYAQPRRNNGTLAAPRASTADAGNDNSACRGRNVRKTEKL